MVPTHYILIFHHHVFAKSSSTVIILFAGTGEVTAGFAGVSSEGIVIATAWLVDGAAGSLFWSCSQETGIVGWGSTLLSLSLNALSAICLEKRTEQA